jgi:hypothetical protein
MMTALWACSSAARFAVRPSERTLTNKEKAISYTAYRALAGVMPNTWLAPPPVVCPPIPLTPESVYKRWCSRLGYDPNDKSTDIEMPAGIANVACGAVLDFAMTINRISLATWQAQVTWRSISLTTADSFLESAPEPTESAVRRLAFLRAESLRSAIWPSWAPITRLYLHRQARSSWWIFRRPGPTGHSAIER